MNEILSLSTGEDEKVFLRERSFFSGKINALRKLFNVSEIDVAQLFAKEQDFLLEYYGGTLPKNVSVDNPAIESLIWHNVKLNLELDASKTLAFTDALTGLGNRHAFDTEMQKRITNDPNNTSLILLDIDDFKLINDNLGHPAGDAVIRAVAKAVIRHTRDCDLSVRYGGEEFAIIINGSFDNAFKIANRIRLDVEKTDINRLLNLNGPQVKITVSGGISGYKSADDTQKAIDLLTQKADNALYEAKHHGKNVIMIKSY